MADVRFYAKTLLLALPLVAGCATLSQWSSQGTGTNSGGKANNSEALIERVAAALDNPEEIFARAGYEPLWTEEKSSVSSRLPKGLTTVSKDKRVWEDWFRKTLTNGGEQLSTKDLLLIKKTVIETVANDPACQFQTPGNISEIAASVENARKKALLSLGVDKPSSALIQMTRLDACTAEVKGQWNYGTDTPGPNGMATPETSVAPDLLKIEQNPSHPRYPTPAQYLKGHYKLDCSRSVLLAMYLVREVEKQNPTGLTVGNVYIFTYHKNGTMGLHANMVAQISCGETKATLYYDPTPDGVGSMRNFNLTKLQPAFGPLDRASVEDYVNRNCIAVSNDPYTKKGEGKQFVGWTYFLGENWSQVSGLGNFNMKATGGAADWDGFQPGKVAFEGYVKRNVGKNAALSQVIQEVYEGKL